VWLVSVNTVWIGLGLFFVKCYYGLGWVRIGLQPTSRARGQRARHEASTGAREEDSGQQRCGDTLQNAVRSYLGSIDLFCA